MKSIEKPDVLIVGGGPVGLATALDLGLRGTSSVVIERDPATAAVLLAKAGTLSERTMEIFRRWGIYGEVVASGFPADHPLDNVYCTSLDGFFIGRDVLPSASHRMPPAGAVVTMCKCPQLKQDPILAKAALATGRVSIRYGTEFLNFSDDGKSVRSTLEDIASGERVCIESKYLVACDGAASTVRGALGIAFEGEKLLSYSISALIRIERLEQYHPLRLANRYMFIDDGGTWANLTGVDGTGLWRFTLVGGLQKQDIAEESMTRHIRRALGAGVPFEIERIVPWRRSQCLASSYGAGRVLLAGDAAHTTSPTGGHGLNTGIGDAVGLGWVLDALCKGWGGDNLLQAYEVERRQVANFNIQASTLNFKAWIGATDFEGVNEATAHGVKARKRVGRMLREALKPEWISFGVALGYRYEGSPCIVPDGTPAPPQEIGAYEQTARPGHRAPHVWLPNGKSTHDLFGNGFVLLRIGANPPPASQLANAARQRNIPLEVVDLPWSECLAAYEQSLVLVRPDDQVAWRGDSIPDDAGSLLDVVSGRHVHVPETVAAGVVRSALQATNLQPPDTRRGFQSAFIQNLFQPENTGAKTP